MKRFSSALNTPRRIFLAVIGVLMLVLAWELSKPWRTGIREHKVGGGSILDRSFGRSTILHLGTNRLYWFTYGEEARGILYVDYPSLMWHFRACTRTNLQAVTPQDTHGDYYGLSHQGGRMFGDDWQTNFLVIHDGQILLVRHSSDTQTVYALQVVRQIDNTGYFRSRKILPAPNNDAVGRHP